MSTSADTLDSARDAILWSVQISSRYHMRRQAFFERWARVTAAIGVIFGSSAVGGVLSETTPRWLIGITGALTAIASTVDLVVGTAVFARRHDELRKRFIEFESEVRRTLHVTDQLIADWQAKRLQIEADEPPSYCAVVYLCENELGRAEGVGNRARIGPWVRWTSHMFRWENLAPHNT